MKSVYCIWLVTTSDHHVINDYVPIFDELKIRKYNVINSVDQHYWMFIVECEEMKFKKLYEWAKKKIGKGASSVTAFQIDSAHRYHHRELGHPVYLHDSLKVS